MKCDSEDRVFKLSKQDVAALVEFASTDKTRTSLTCVRFEPEQGTAIATDGHAIVVAKNCGTYREDAFSVPLEPLVAMAKLLKKGDYLAVQREDDRAVVITTPSGAAARATIPDEMFPEWRQVIPQDQDEPPARRVGFDAMLLARLPIVQKASECFGGEFTMPGAEMDPIKVVFQGPETTWTAVVMPMRV
jgi:hypothetical protein